MTVAHDGWSIHRGTTREWDFDLVDRVSGAPLSVSGAEIRYVLAQSLAGPPLIDATAAPTVTVVDAAAGQIHVKLTPDLTAALPLGRVLHQVVVTDQEGDGDVVLEGHGEILPVVRAA